VTLRIVGILTLIAGAAIATYAIYAFVATPSMAENLALTKVDLADWSLRWRLSSSVVGLVGGLLVIAGLALLLRRSWGLILVCAAATVVAVFPWVLELSGLARYGFERAHLIETVVAAAIGLGAVTAYVHLIRPRVGA
jgi:hypothetical protein